MQDAVSMKDKYRVIGPVYDLLSTLYSGKSIHNCKVAMLNPRHLKPGDKVLFAGVGHGRDAIQAAELGAEVTVVDLSETMLRKFQEQLERSGKQFRHPIRSIHSDILKVAETETYDMVVANFFLNVFSETMMAEVLRHLVSLAKPGGKIVVGDFTDATGNLISRAVKKAYWYVAVGVFWVMAKNAFHPIYDYPQHMRALGLEIEDMQYFKLLNMECYRSVLGRKPSRSA